VARRLRAGENATRDQPASSRCASNPVWKPISSTTVANSKHSSAAPPEIKSVLAAVFRMTIRWSARVNNQVGVLAGNGQ